MIIRRCGDILLRQAVLCSSNITIQDRYEKVPSLTERHIRRRKMLRGAPFAGMIILHFCGDILPRRAVLSSSSTSVRDLDNNVPSLTERYVTDVKCCRALSSASANGVSIRQFRHASSNMSADVKCCWALLGRWRFDCGDNPSLWRYYPRRAMLVVAASAHGISMRKSRCTLSDTSADVKCCFALSGRGRTDCVDNNPSLVRYYPPSGRAG